MAKLLICVFLGFTSAAWTADFEQHVHKAVKVNTAQQLSVRTDLGSIRVHPGSGDIVEIDVLFRGSGGSRAEFDRILRDFKFEAIEQGADVAVTGKFPDGRKPYSSSSSLWSLLFGGSSPLRDAEFEITVPARFGARLTTAGGAITVAGLNQDVNARTSGGPMRFEKIHGEVNGNTSGGPIDVNQVTGRVRVETSGGPINLNDVTGAVQASTSGGSVSAVILGQPEGDCRLTTSGGSISVRLASDVKMKLDAATSGGSIATDFPVPYSNSDERTELHANLNGGGPLLYLHTSGGGISIHRGAARQGFRGSARVN